MIEVYPNLYVGSMYDYETIVAGKAGWAVVHACKPYHRSAVGYRTWSLPRNHPEYMVARRENRLMLCLLDCMKGRSRSASITLLYLATRLRVLPTDSFEAAEEEFRRLYPRYHATRGIRGHVRRNWREYC